MNTRKIVKLERKYSESKLQWFILATYSDSTDYVPNSGLTEKGSKGCLTRLAKVFGLLKISSDLAVLDEAVVNENDCTNTKEAETKTMTDKAWNDTTIANIKSGVPHVVVLHDREALIKYDVTTNVMFYNMGHRNKMYLNNNAEVKPYHIFYDIRFTYKKERGEQFYRVFAELTCSQMKNNFSMTVCKKGTDLKTLQSDCVAEIWDSIKKFPQSLGLSMATVRKLKPYQNTKVIDRITITNHINSIINSGINQELPKC